jgi:ubiquinone/menaquinone biosynthesis C-methylase UbiE
METALAVAYAVGLEAIYRARLSTPLGGSEALDLASGPGLFTLGLHRYLKYSKVTGIDLSEPMVELARQNASEKGLSSQASFRQGDITKIGEIAACTYDLTTFTDAAHHMPDLGSINSILLEMDRVTKPDGLVLLMDLARLRTAHVTERYVDLLGSDYLKIGLPYFFNQFRDSMYAAWTCAELTTAIPEHSRRIWCHIYAKRLPTLQIILGLPIGQKNAFLRRGSPWLTQDNPVPKKYRSDWSLARATMFWSEARYLYPDGKTKLRSL